MVTTSESKKVADYCTENLNFTILTLSDEYHYSFIPLCVVDSVFSIGVNYKSVQKVIKNTCRYFGIEALSKEPSNTFNTSEFIEKAKSYDPEFLANNVFNNRQRTSSRAGILKAEAVILFLRQLQKFGVEDRHDIFKISNSIDFEDCIKVIPGQKSGISTKYFFMLAGDDNLIKPDRMIVRFLESALARKVSIGECQELLSQACNVIKATHEQLTPKVLDNLIWQYQRSAAAKTTQRKN